MIILINGQKRSGKDFIADIIVEEYKDLNFRKASYASFLKKIIADTFEISLSKLEELKNNETKLFYFDVCKESGERVPIEVTNFRKILQRFGTEAMKPVFGDGVWGRLLHQKILEDGGNFVISDFRFVKEYDDAVEIFGRDKIVTLKIKTSDDLKDQHISENDLENNNFSFDYVINNERKDETIYGEVDKFMEIIYEKLRK